MPQPPRIFPVSSIDLPSFEQHVLPNGLPCYHINRGTQDVVRIEFVCWGGRPYEKHPLVARTTATLLKEGTRHHQGSDIAERFDYYGAYLGAPFQMDTGNLAMHSLNKQLPQVLPLFIEMLCEPALRQADLQAYCKRKKQSLKSDLSKAEVVAYRKITEYFYGDKNPYGYNSSVEKFDALQADWLHEHHYRCFHAGNGFALISGRFDETTASYIHGQLARIPQRKEVASVDFPLIDALPRKIIIPHEQGGQAAIRIGRKLFPRTHPDANGCYILSNLLGGYFGSRLMENIREDKGYTYNISASYDSFRHSGTFQIDTEVSPEFVAPTLKEIHYELARLRDELVEEEELQMLRNYLMGSFLTMVDGPFNWAETVRTLLTEDVDISNLSNLIETVNEITPEELQRLAQKYWQEEDLWTVVVGPQT
jgi:predicted Zn-dependent peptidase